MGYIGVLSTNAPIATQRDNSPFIFVAGGGLREYALPVEVANEA